MLLIVGCTLAACALVLTALAYITDDPSGYDWQLVLVLTVPMFALSTILGCIGAYLIRKARGHGGSDLEEILRVSNGTPIQ